MIQTRWGQCGKSAGGLRSDSVCPGQQVWPGRALHLCTGVWVWGHVPPGQDWGPGRPWLYSLGLGLRPLAGPCPLFLKPKAQLGGPCPALGPQP